MKNKILLLSISLIIALQLSAQISDDQYQKIDSLFVDWNKPNHPGGVIGIEKDGKIIFSKAYGLASLEYLTPNSTETIFNTASVSKQFTAMGIVLLQDQGKLSVDDDIRKYLPELPDFRETVTIRHMLHHTSGLRSLHAMLGLAGWRDDDSRTDEDLYRYMKNQRDLNFKTGEEFLYCNTGYILMAKIIEKVTGEKFSTWMKRSIFEPLGMIHTYVEDKYNRVVPNNATSYYANTEGFDRAVEYWGYVGSGNMHSTTSDLLKWLTNFYNPKSNWESSFKTIQTLDKLNNGMDNNYAFGVFIDEFNGENRIQHAGGIGGFGSFICTYPNQKLSIVILTNFSSSSVSFKSNQVAKLLLENIIPSENNSTVSSTKFIDLPNNQLEKFASSYWNDKDNYARKIYLKNDTLRYFRSENSESTLVPFGKNKFKMLDVDVNLTVEFEVRENEDKIMIVTIDDGSPIFSKAFVPVIPSKTDLSQYSGKFFSPELETTYTISVVDDTLSWHHPRHGDYKIKMLKKDVLEGQSPFSVVKYKRDENGEIIGILVSNGRVRNLWFEKQQKN